MKRKFTFLIAAALMLLTMMATTGTMWGQTRSVTYEATTSIAVDDVVLLVAESSNYKKELSGFTTSGTIYGTVSDYTQTPNGVYPLTVVSGNSEGSFAFMNSDNKYLSWSSGNSLQLSETLNDNSSWTFNYAYTVTTITNVGTTARQIKYNSSSPRFACYTSGQQSIKLYKQVSSSLTDNDIALTGAPVALSFDLYNNSAAQTINYTTSSTGAVTIADNQYINTEIDEANKTITVTPVKVTPSAQTITVNQAADANYAAGSTIFTVNITNSAPYDQPTEIEALLNNDLFGTNYTGSVSGITDNNPIVGTKDNVTVTYAGSGNHYVNNSQIRFYPSNKLTFEAPSGYEIKQIVFTSAGTWAATISANGGTYNSSTKTWTGSATSVLFTGSGSSRCDMSKADIIIGAVSSLPTPTITIDATGITNTNVFDSTDAGSLSATVTYNDETVQGATVTWSGNNNAVATIDENSGAVTLVAAGSVTFTATFAGNESYNSATAQHVMTVTNDDPNAPGTVNNPYTVAAAMAATPTSGTSANVYIHGIVSAFYNTSIVGDGSNYRYYISDDGTTTSQLLVYKGKGLNNEAFSKADDLLIGDEIILFGGLTMYQNAPEVAANNYIVSLERPVQDVATPTFSVAAGTYASAQEVEISCETDGATIYYTLDGTEPTNASTPYNGALNIETTTTVKAIAYKNTANSYVATATYHICSAETPYTVAQALAFNEYPTSTIWVHGIVSTAPTTAPSSGQLKYYISDNGEATNELYIYNGKGLNNAAFTAQDDIQVGDIVTITGIVKDYQGTLEFDSGNYLTSFERPTVATPTFTPEEGEYTEAQSVTIACATEGATIYYKTAENAEWAVYSEAINVTETTTIWAYAAKEGMNNSAVATATYTINIPVITASITVEPALVEATAEGGEGTLTVTYTNITEINADVYFCNENGDAATYDWIEAEIDDNNNVYYVIGANEGEARTAYFKVYALDDNAEDVYSNLVTINQAAYIAPSQEVVDVLDNSFTGITGTTYTEWTNTGTSDAVYVGFSAGQNSTIQLRTKNSNEGIITTTSGGKVTKVEATWNDNTSSGRKLDIYGKNTAYSEVSDLYNNEKQGTKLGTIKYDDNEPLLISGDYEFIGIRSNDGALYLDEIQITWSTTPAGPSITVTPAEITDVSAAGDIPEHTVILANLNISSTDDFLFAYCDLEGNILGNTDPKPNWIELAEAEYTATGENVYSMVYTVAANEETTPRTGYFKIGIEQATETVYSNIVTVTQLGYVTPVATITVVPNEVLDVPAAGDVYVHTVTLENMTVESTDDFTLAFCDENGEVLDEQAPKPDWIEIGDVEFAVTSEENVYSLTYPVAENTETTPRTAYFKVAATQTSEAVYSNLVTVTQDGYVPPVVADNYELFSGDLVEGDYLIVYDGVAMNNTLSGKRFGYDEVTITNNTISNSSNTIVWHIAPSETTGYWTLYNVEKEKYASNGGSSMDMSLSATSDNDNTLWSVTAPGETTHEFRNKNNESQSARYLRRNGTYGFACYATGTGGPLSLYKKVDNTPSILLGGDQNIGTTHATGKEVSTNFTVTQYNLTADITLTTSIGALSTYSIEVDAEPTEVTWTHTFTEPGDIDVTITATSGETTKSIHITGEVKQSHLINIADVEHGTIAVVDDKTTAIENENVDFTVTPDEGYVIDEIIVMAGENQVEYMQGETFYRFQMPDSDVTISATFTETVSEYYELFSGDLVEGDYLIVYDGVAMNNTLSGKRFGYDEVTITNNTISNSSNTIVWHIAPSETTGYWTLYNVEKEKYASNGGSSMDMSLSATSDNDNTLWSVTAPGETTHEFRNKNNESQSARYLRRNGTYGFACYATGTGGPLSLYKKVDNTPSLSFNGPTANIGTYAVGEEIVWDNITVTQHNLTENILLSAKKGTVNPASIDAGAEPTQVTWSYTPTAEGYTTDTITATSGTLEATLILQFMAKTPHNIYTVVENGIIVVLDNKTTAIENENVDFTVTPDEGYELNEITVMAGETPVEYMIDETFYRFQMPDSDVTISATFNALPTYTIKFYVNGEQDEALTISDIVEGNSTALPTASTLTPAGFSIAGWAEEGSTIAVADPYTPTDNVDLYALFQLDNAQTTSGNYVKVTEELTDWSGEYLIVYEDGNVAFNGNLETFDAVENTVNVEIASSTIIANDAMNNASFTIAPMTGGYSIQGTSGKYIGVGSYANGLTTNDDPVANAISIDESGNALITITFTGGDMTLKYNDAENQLRFRYYKSGQKDIQLYKKESTSFNTITILDNTIPEQTISDPIPNATCVVVPNNVTLTYTGPNPSTPEALVVQEGGQLIHTTDVEATVQKGISAYSTKSGDGWYLIASPVDNYSTSTIATGTYDLFIYNEPNAYWYSSTGAAAPFNTLERGKGYLYANAANVNLNYAGTMKATNANIKVDLSYACDEYPYLKGFNLVGNPFTRNITAADMVIGATAVTSYYDFDDDREEFVTYQTNERPIQPGQGFFIQATDNDQQLEFNPPTSKDASDFKYISISAGDENFTDKAYIQFGYGNTLRKMTFGENTMVYVMNDDDDYAAARVEELAGTMPVHFVTIEDGFYTITVETKNIENLNYMHLIDNIKNTEIDLLVEPSYTFKASESDNADRFYLVFDFNNYTGVNENYTNGNFAHQIGEEIFVSGEGTLQVFDVLGRFVASYNVNGDKRISTAEFNTGVYIFRMVGTEVKTQKIIVR